MNELNSRNNKQINQRRILHRFIDRPVDYLIRHNQTPNRLSLYGFISTLIFSTLIASGILHTSVWWGWIGPFFLFWAGAFDVFDGEVARRTSKISKAGAFLDSNLDRVSDGLIVIGMIFGNLINYITGFILLFLIIMISYTRARAENEGVDMAGIGMMERAERLITLFFSFIIEIWVYYLTKMFFGSASSLFFDIFILIFIGLLLITIIQRIVFSYKNLREFDRTSNSKKKADEIIKNI